MNTCICTCTCTWSYYMCDQTKRVGAVDCLAATIHNNDSYVSSVHFPAGVGRDDETTGACDNSTTESFEHPRTTAILASRERQWQNNRASLNVETPTHRIEHFLYVVVWMKCSDAGFSKNDSCFQLIGLMMPHWVTFFKHLDDVFYHFYVTDRSAAAAPGTTRCD